MLAGSTAEITNGIEGFYIGREVEGLECLSEELEEYALLRGAYILPQTKQMAITHVGWNRMKYSPSVAFDDICPERAARILNGIADSIDNCGLIEKDTTLDYQIAVRTRSESRLFKTKVSAIISDWQVNGEFVLAAERNLIRKKLGLKPEVIPGTNLKPPTRMVSLMHCVHLEKEVLNEELIYNRKLHIARIGKLIVGTASYSPSHK